MSFSGQKSPWAVTESWNPCHSISTGANDSEFTQCSEEIVSCGKSRIRSQFSRFCTPESCQTFLSTARKHSGGKSLTSLVI